jgi:hypothetical protein
MKRFGFEEGCPSSNVKDHVGNLEVMGVEGSVTNQVR